MDACFPLWAEQGVYGSGFLEALNLDHKPIETPDARVRVQARQTYVFASAYMLGWQREQARQLVKLGLDALKGASRRSDGLFGRRINLKTAALIDDVADLYDTAFALYALASVQRMVGQSGADALTAQAAALMQATDRAIEMQLVDPSGGYGESLPRPEYRLQNPHMHLFEARLIQAALGGGGSYLTQAEKLLRLCQTSFIDAATGTLGEVFQPATWQPAPGAPGAIVEPGHQFEWVWLMHEYARMTRTPPVPEAAGLYRFACKTLDGEGRAVQSCRRDGTPVDTSRRTWPQTEALKAHLAMWRAGDQAASARAVASFKTLMTDYLTPKGGWIDHYDTHGKILSQTMPASTGYHVVLAFAHLIHTVQT
jgi:mannose-6-phosphate isomerase